MRTPTWSEPLGMLLLRLGLAWFIFVWAGNKFTATGQYQFIMQRFDGIEAGPWMVYAIATFQIAICVLVMLGQWRTVTYALLAGIHALTIYRVWPGFLEPFAVSEKGFPVNRNGVNALAIFLAMIALWLLRGRDTWSLDALRARRRA